MRLFVSEKLKSPIQDNRSKASLVASVGCSTCREIQIHNTLTET